MSQFVFKYLANRLLRDNQLNKFGVEDPYYEYIPLDEQGKRTKKVKRRTPAGLSTKDIDVLDTLRKKAYRYDMWFNFLGVKFGWSNVVGIIPIAGSIVATYWSLTMLVAARQLEDGLPLDIHFIFIFNVLIDFLLGLIPIVGDLIEIGYKANSRNFLLIEKHLERVGQKNLGLIEPNEVRPSFINDKVQPVFEEKIVPGTIKAGEQIKNFVNDQYNSIQKKKKSTSNTSLNTSSVRPGSSASASATTQTSSHTVLPHSVDTADSTAVNSFEDDSKSIKSVKSLNKRYQETENDTGTET
ncbi:hypothetical protein CLIB1423_19S01860 [[Candida] railenensis]|uniref:DUF4112 domain-containing protein n=1 Tax=[Candida] railenensis TaxID=45579 RepID=A0A9P0QTX5_9ASCO|nr:hypothetical protein CLIB1423_19S01860 [[Candida] railenensis]